LNIQASYFVVRDDGRSDAHWRGVLRKDGCPVDGSDDPVFRDLMPSKVRGQDIGLEHLPSLVSAVKYAARCLVLVVPDFGHFISQKVFRAAAALMLGRGVTVRAVEGGAVVLNTAEDIEKGFELVKDAINRGKGRRLADSRKALGTKTGPSKMLVGARREQALMMCAQTEEWSSLQAIADHLGVSRSTIARALDDAAGTQSRQVARDLLAVGKWPPKRKVMRRKKFDPHAIPGKKPGATSE
jgi:hypothetical protein